MMVSRIAVVALVATAFGSSAALAECGAHKQSVDSQTTVTAESAPAQTPIPEGALAVSETPEAPAPQPRAAAAKSE